MSTSGTFSPERLKLFRELRSMTRPQLAELVDVTRQAVSQFERGDTTPSADTLFGLADALAVEPISLQRPVIARGEANTFFRSFSTATKRARVSASRWSELVREVVDYCSDFIALPEVDFEIGVKARSATDLSTEDVLFAADSARESWGLGSAPLSSIGLIAENRGAVMSYVPFDSKLDAFSLWSPHDRRPYLLVSSVKKMWGRVRFSIAHEIGHIVMHRWLDPNELTARSGHKLLESQANLFAANFLLPSSTYLEDLISPTLDEFVRLKQIWGASVKMQIYYLRQKRIIDDAFARRLYQGYSRRGWNVQEPFDELLPAERPRLLRRSIQMIRDAEVRTSSAIVAGIGLPQPMIEDIAALPRGFLTPSVNVQLLDSVRVHGVPRRG